MDQKYIENFKLLSWRKMEKKSWTDRVRNEEMLYRVKEERKILNATKIRRSRSIGQILHRNIRGAYRKS